MADDYDIRSILYDGGRTRISLATRRSDQKEVVLKSARPGGRHGDLSARLEHEYHVLRHLGMHAQADISFETIDGVPTLVRPASASKPLDEGLRTLRSRGLLEQLKFAKSLSLALQKVHEAGVIHKDINPFNILWSPETGQVEIIDFGISALLQDEASELVPPENLEGTLPYVSPEQTGRMRLTIDRRSDLYSLGATLYQLLGDRLPFEASDVAEMVHSHLAVVPTPLSELPAEVPEPVSAIVAMLLEKEPERRYRTAAGLAADLDRCIRMLEENGSLKRFELGQQDSLSLFKIPDRLYGREGETGQLLESFQVARGGQFRLMLISGYSGVGKSSLVHQIQKPVVECRAYYASGKFDQLQRDVPYATLVQALKGLIRQVLKGSSENLQLLRASILEAVGENGALLIDVIPELELIIGGQPEVPELPPAEAHNRFFRVLTGFIRVFAKKEHPLVLFLDDLQWTDAPTLEVVERMANSSDFPYIFLIGAYRDNEVDPTHPVLLMVDHLEKSGVDFREMKLTPLGEEAIAELVADTMHCSLERATPLARLCISKTGGNPFFLGQFLKSLRRRGLIHFGKSKQRWEWNLELIHAQQVTENVVDLMTGQLCELPDRTQRILRLAACIGNQFDLGTLAVVAQESVSQVLDDLWSAMNELLILPEDSSYRYAGQGGLEGDGSTSGSEVRFRFLHDRVQQACYELIGEQEAATLHLEIGRLLLQSVSAEEASRQSFSILAHYNTGLAGVTDPNEKKELARLNLSAGRRALAAAAYEAAAEYLETGLSLLGAGHWESEFKLCFDLHAAAIEARYLNHDYEGMEALAAEVLERIRTPVDRALIEGIRIQALMSRNDPVAAIRLALQVLRTLGVRLPSRPNDFHSLLGLALTEWRLRRRNIEDLVSLPEMSNAEKLAAIKIIYFVFSSAYFAMPKMYPLLIFQIVKLSLSFGNTAASAFGYSGYGVIQSGLLKRVDYGNRFGRLSLALVDKLGARQIKPRVLVVTHGFNTVYRTHSEELLEDFLEGYKMGLEVGDFEFASYAAHMRCMFLLWNGVPLRTVEAEMEKFTHPIEQMDHTSAIYQHKLWHQFTINLLGEAEDPLKMVGQKYDESSMVAVHEEAKDALPVFFLQCCKLFLGVLLDDSETAVEAAVRGEELNRSGVGFGHIAVPLFYEWAALAWIDAYRRGDTDIARRELLKNAKRCVREVGKWAKCSPVQAEFRYSLVRAELASVEQRHSSALRHFQDSLQQARNHRSLVDVAVACHRMGEHFLRRNYTELADVYLMEAGTEYRRWQADAILNHLAAKYPGIHFSGRSSKGRTTDSAEAFALLARSTWSSGSMDSTGGGVIDLVSVVKSAQALSGEIILDRLLERIMEIMVENAGANQGALLLLKDGEMKIEAEIGPEGTTAVLQSLPLSSEKDGRRRYRVAEELVNFVARSEETIVLEDAARLGDFVTDPYVTSNRSRSMICIPLSNQGRLIGLLHLENTVARSAFSLERVNVLSALSAQAAIAIENARLYSNLDALNQSYARFVPYQFLEILDRKSIIDVEIGDQVQGEMTVLFSDIEGFTGLSEALTPEETFELVNRYLRKMEPAIMESGGFIDKYIGDAIMSIFPAAPDGAVRAALKMLELLQELNEELVGGGHQPLKIGSGINTGSLMLGVVGGTARLETTVISDSVNLSARLESMTRYYDVPLLISEHTRRKIGESEFTEYIRRIDRVVPKGKRTEVEVYEVFAADPVVVRDAKVKYDRDFQRACALLDGGKREEAESLFRALLEQNPDDRVVEYYLQRCAGAPPPGETFRGPA